MKAFAHVSNINDANTIHAIDGSKWLRLVPSTMQIATNVYR